MIRHITLAVRLAVVGLYILVMCWFVPDAIAITLEKGLDDDVSN